MLHWRLPLYGMVLVTGFTLALPPASRAEEYEVRFTTDVVPVLTKLGCNSGGCHGKATGQNGFKLSLLGFDPEFDYQALAKELRGRRVFPAAPDQSLVLLKAIGEVPHGGGRRLNQGDAEYDILRQWIDRGARGPQPEDPTVLAVKTTPARQTVGLNSRQQLRVLATLSDGQTRDVTRLAVYESNEPSIATVSQGGLVETANRSGLFSVMVRYGGKIATVHSTVPFDETDTLQSTRERLAVLDRELTSKVDRLLLRQWQQLGVAPSERADDYTFIRRASLDICGTLPTEQAVETFVADTRADKESRLIDELLERPEYATFFALKWADILQNRGSGYSTSQQRPGTTLFSSWIRDSFESNKPYDQFAAEILTATGNQNENPPTVWYRQVRTLPDYVESVAQAFLGVRIQCAQCHHHPFDRWSQADYYGLAAVFARVGRKGGFADAEVPTNQVIYLKDESPVLHPRSGRTIPPKALGGPVLEVERYEDPRRAFAEWMTSPENPLFARAFANRLWAHFMGRGIVHPIGDARSSNPPTNPELLDALSQEFASHDFDIKHLIRVICNSYSYRLVSSPNASNRDDEQTFARFYPRRMPAEVMLDAISQVLDVPTQFSGGPGAFPVGMRAIALPDENVPASFLDVFGRPGRTTACECERVDAPSLAQALTLVNSPEIQRKLTTETGFAQQLAQSAQSNSESSRQIFLRLFGREPESAELATCIEFLEDEADRVEAFRSLLWSLLATNEFMFNH